MLDQILTPNWPDITVNCSAPLLYWPNQVVKCPSVLRSSDELPGIRNAPSLDSKTTGLELTGVLRELTEPIMLLRLADDEMRG